MRRKTLGVVLLVLAALPLRAQQMAGPVLVTVATTQRQADALQAAAVNPSIDGLSVRDRAAGMFEDIQRETPLVRPAQRLMDRELVDGRVGTIDGMIAAAKGRYDHYKMTTTEVPAADLAHSIDYAKVLRGDKRADFEKGGKMAENQMGEFVYKVEDKLDAGMVEINARMALIATRIGEVFSYATLVHEATHANARAEGRLSPDHVIDGEVEAYRVEYRWLKVIDPSAERMIVMISTLNLHLQRHPGDQVTRTSITYLQHLLTLWDTGGDDQKLRAMIQDLGYEDGDKNHGGGVNPAATGPRV